ncbi:MAG: nicotinate-nucleotide adenylyltransferase [Bacillota bacterium]
MIRARYGLMGGTFDPIHIGHLLAAETVREEFALERVIFIPSAHPPHKRIEQVTPAAIRYKMVKLAVRNHRSFAISDCELKRKGPSFTVDTLSFFHGEFPEAEFYFITGADALFELVSWKDMEKLFSLCSFVGVTRHGYNLDNALHEHPSLQQYRHKMHFLEIPKVEISSTYIRQRRADEKSIKYLVPPAVERFIVSRRLYRAQKRDI